MLKGNEKRIFWIVVMAIAVVSLVTSIVSSFVVSVDYMIYFAKDLGIYPDSDFVFGAAFLMLALLVIVLVAAVMHICIKGRRSLKAKIICAAVIGGYFLLSSIIFTIVFHVAEIGQYSALMEYITVTLAITVSYEIAFLAQCMLTTRNTAGIDETNNS